MAERASIRRLDPSDVAMYRAIRLAALEECPAAFATDADAWRDAPAAIAERHLQRSSHEPGSPILGAWTHSDDLVGLVGMNREQRRSVSHKASLWGMYVSPAHRRQGIGRALVTEALTTARGMPGLRQIRAVVVTSSDGALALFSSLGFERFGLEREARFVDGVFHDQVYLSYPLSAC